MARLMFMIGLHKLYLFLEIGPGIELLYTARDYRFVNRGGALLTSFPRDA